jgi:orotidine-5'-phosphate decarboxylase
LGGADLQAQRLSSGEMLYEHIAQLAQGEWNDNGQLGLVVGATAAVEIARVREIAPTLPLLIPGVGAQGGDAQAAVHAGWRARGGRTSAPIIVNSSRAVLYASRGNEFAAAARSVASDTRALLNAARRARADAAS